MSRFGAAERRARLARRHRLAPEARTDDPVEAARAVVALHSSDPPSVFLAARARASELTVERVERALYDERTLVRMTGMRNTLFVVPTELLGVVQAACATKIAPRERRRLVQMVEGGGIAQDGKRWVARVERKTLAALHARGEATGAELSQDVPELREQVRVGEGKRWETTVSVTTRMLVTLAAEGRIVRGRPRGSWISSQYRWTPVEDWLGKEMPALNPVAAEAELARRWLAAFGPATSADLKWWTGWSATQVTRALDTLGAAEVDLDGAGGFVLDGDREPEPTEPWAALLPALDPTVMGWAERGWFLGDHGSVLFDRNGNAGPTVWWDGRVVGGWTQRKDGEIAYRLLEDVGADGVVAIDAEAERLAAFIGETRMTPRFRTPLERELAA